MPEDEKQFRSMMILEMVKEGDGQNAYLKIAFQEGEALLNATCPRWKKHLFPKLEEAYKDGTAVNVIIEKKEKTYPQPDGSKKVVVYSNVTAIEGVEDPEGGGSTRGASGGYGLKTLNLERGLCALAASLIAPAVSAEKGVPMNDAFAGALAVMEQYTFSGKLPPVSTEPAQ